MIATLVHLIPVAAELEGKIQGGMGYVYACYGITWGTFLLYTISLVIRQKNLENS